MRQFNERALYTTMIIFGLFVVIALFGCAGGQDYRYVENSIPCTVDKDAAGNGVITCPDGSSVTVPPDVIINETIVNVPVIIVKKCDKK